MAKKEIENKIEALKVPGLEKKRSVAGKVFLCLLFSLLCVAGAYFAVSFSNEDTQSKEVYINSAEEFKAHLSKSQFPATTYILREDISLNEEDYVFSGAGAVLSGIFLGQGNKITLYGESPLFDRLTSTGVIRNLSVKNASINSDNASVAVLTRVNDGLIENCAVIESKIEIRGATIYAAGFAAHNYGTIKNCTADVSFSEASGAAGARFFAGGVTAVGYDGSAIENVVAKITFPANFSALSKALHNNEVNMRVGYLVGSNMGEVKNSYACDAAFINTATDIKSELTQTMTLASIDEGFVLSKLLWLTDYWELVDGKLPKLKVLVRAS